MFTTKVMLYVCLKYCINSFTSELLSLHSLNFDNSIVKIEVSVCNEKGGMTNSVDPNETAYLDLHCLRRHLCWSAALKGLTYLIIKLRFRMQRLKAHTHARARHCVSKRCLLPPCNNNNNNKKIIILIIIIAIIGVQRWKTRDGILVSTSAW